MTQTRRPGLGELLRYVGELIDQGAQEQYRAMNLDYRPRYTPVLRALAAGAETISDITAATHLTQGAISQSVLLMAADGLVSRHELADGRKTGVRTTAKGKRLLTVLVPHWEVTFAAIDALEEEVGYPLRQVLENTAKALEREGFAARLNVARRAVRRHAADQAN
jgi:DNA-binding MarR family transcriptional regulator